MGWLECRLLVAILCSLQAVATRYQLTPGQRILNAAGNLTEIRTTNGQGIYRILNNGTSDILSENSTFALAFLDPNGSEHFYLSVVMQSGFNVRRSSAAAVPVWIANRNQSVSNGATLMLTETHRKFILLDGGYGGNLVWKSDAVGIDSIELDKFGNLSFISKNSSVFQSFEHPGDTLVTDQRLKSGMSLTLNPSMGAFSAQLSQNSFQLLFSSVPYSTRPLSHSCEDKYVALNKAGDVKLNCDSLPIISAKKTPAEMTLPFVRLDPDGDLVVYGFESLSQGWVAEARFSDGDTCRLPLSCGKYGLCETGGKCRCLQVPSKGNEVFANVSSQNCSGPTEGIPQVEICENEAYNHHFVNATGVEYFSTPSVRADKTDSNVNECYSDCLLNCSCMAMFYDNALRECYFVSDAVIGSFSTNPNVSGFIKFQNAHMNFGMISSPKPNKSNVGPIAAGASAAAVTVLILALLVMFSLHRRNRKKKQSSEIDAVLSTVRGLPQRFTYQVLETATKGFSTKLGTGGFGSVYEGFLPDGRHVAVKKLEGNSTQGARQFVAEVATIGGISHVNIVKLCGFCLEDPHRILVYDFMPNSSLDRWLFESNLSASATPDRRRLSWERRVDIALGTARGLAYLHEECSEPIIHLDVKPQNILLDERFVAKVADFGMSKLLLDHDVSQVMTCVRGTPGYLAPEWLLHSVATKKCDVYSFGMVLLEIIGGRKNLEVSRMNTDLAWYFPAWVVNEVRQGNVMGVIDEKVRDTVGLKQATRMVHIALWCIQENASLRPNMEEVTQMIEGRREVDEPPMQFHFAVQTQAIVDITASRESVSMSSRVVFDVLGHGAPAVPGNSLSTSID